MGAGVSEAICKDDCYKHLEDDTNDDAFDTCVNEAEEQEEKCEDCSFVCEYAKCNCGSVCCNGNDAMDAALGAAAGFE